MKDNKGITLLALAITIIILTVLAGVTISALVGDDGIFEQADIAISDEKMQEERENIQLAYMSALTSSEYDDITESAFRKSLKAYANIESFDLYDYSDSFIIINNENNKNYIINKTTQSVEPYEVPELTEAIYANYYDGTLTFTNHLVNNGTVYNIGNGSMEATTIPWESVKANITKVVFAEKIVPKNTQHWFNGCTNLTTIEHIDNLDTSKVEKMAYMFSGCSSLTNLDLSTFRTFNLTRMENMFSGCTNLQTLKLDGFTTDKVNTMCKLFEECQNLQYLDLSHFDAQNVTNIYRMFYNCKKLERVDLDMFKTTSKLTSMTYLFSGCSKLKSADLSKLDTSNITDMSAVFGWCNSLESVNVSSFNTEKVAGFGSMFNSCSSLTTLDLSNFYTPKCTWMGDLFNSCTNLTRLDIRNFDNGKNPETGYMFYNCKALNLIITGDNWDPDNVKSTALAGCKTNQFTNVNDL